MKLLSFLAAMLIVSVLFAACGTESQPTIETVMPAQTPHEPSTQEESALTEQETTPEPMPDISIPENVLFDSEGIRISARGLSDSWQGTALDLLIENDSEIPVTVQVRDVSVNGIMFGQTSMSASVTPGNMANDNIMFLSSGFERNGIETMGVIEFAFRIINNDDWSESFTSDRIVIETSAAGQFNQPLPDTIETIFEQDGIYIAHMCFEETWMGKDVVFFIANDTDEAITIQARDEVINGFMISGSMSSEVLPGKVAIGSLSFGEWQLEENGIEDIDFVEFRFRIIFEDWGDSFETDLIRLTP